MLDLRIYRYFLAGFNLRYVWLKLADGNGILSILYIRRIGVPGSSFVRCLWTLPKILNITNTTNITNRPSLGIWLRIRGYLVDNASQINDYLAKRASTRR